MPTRPIARNAGRSMRRPCRRQLSSLRGFPQRSSRGRGMTFSGTKAKPMPANSTPLAWMSRLCATRGSSTTTVFLMPSAKSRPSARRYSRRPPDVAKRMAEIEERIEELNDQTKQYREEEKKLAGAVVSIESIHRGLARPHDKRKAETAQL